MEAKIGSPVKLALNRAALWLLLLLFLFVALFPFYWMIISSARPDAELYVSEPNLYPNVSTMTLGHYQKLLGTTLFATYYRNSLYVSLATTLLAVFISYPAAYAMTKMRLTFRGLNLGDQIARLVLYTYLVPASVLFIPMFSLMNQLKLSNTPTGLVFVYLTITVPFCTWMMMGFLRKTPTELIEAAMIDGSSKISCMFRIALPLIAPGIASSAIFAFTLSWNEYLYALVLVSSDRMRTITVGISTFIMGDVYMWGMIMASAVLAGLPAIVIYTFAQRFVVAGMTAGGVKG